MRDTDSHTEDQYHDHMRRLRSITTDWKHAAISTREKRRRIVEENKAYYGAPLRSPVNGEWLTSAPRMRDEIAFAIADITGAPLEAVTIALSLRREASAAAADAPTGEESRRLADGGVRAYWQTLTAAGAAVSRQGAAP